MQTSPVLALALVAALGACSPGEEDPALAELTAALETSQRSQDDLAERVVALEELLAVDEEQGTALAELEQQLAGVTAQLQELIGTLEAESQARAAADAQLGEDVTQLGGRIDQLQATVVQLRTSVQELTDEVSSLEAQFRSHRSDDTRHE